MVIALAVVEARKPTARGCGGQPAKAHVTALGEALPVRIASDFESPPYVYSVDVRAHSAPCHLCEKSMKRGPLPKQSRAHMDEKSMKRDRQKRNWTPRDDFAISSMKPVDSGGLRWTEIWRSHSRGHWFDPSTTHFGG